MRQNGLDIGDSITFYEDERKKIVSQLIICFLIGFHIINFINHVESITFQI